MHCYKVNSSVTSSGTQWDVLLTVTCDENDCSICTNAAGDGADYHVI